MEYDVIIATRNRPEALKLSIPLILGQSRKPRQLIIVDASDDDTYEQVRQSVIQAVGDSSVELEILRAKPNLALQRNVGLNRVKAPVVMFPDDDSLWFPEHSEAIMRIYERDKEQLIGGVCAAYSHLPPESLRTNSAYRVYRDEWYIEKTRFFRQKIDGVIFPNVYKVLGKRYLEKLTPPDWLEIMNASPVEYITGFKMSFRTDVISKEGFDEDLGMYVGWAYAEDMDACLNVAKKYLLVGARNARVHHYKYPATRVSGTKAGFIMFLNDLYVTLKHDGATLNVVKYVLRYWKKKILRYMIGAYDKYNCDVIKGFRVAWKHGQKMIRLNNDQLREYYLKCCNDFFES